MQTDSRLHASHLHEQAEWSVASISLFKGTEKRCKRENDGGCFCATVRLSERLLSHFIIDSLLEMVLQFFIGFYSEDFLSESEA